MANREYNAMQKDIEEFMFAVNKNYSNIDNIDLANHSN